MASREIRDLSQEMQVLYNRFFDRCRRDTELLKEGITVLLTCTHREGRGKDRINRVPSEAFEIITLRDGVVEPVLNSAKVFAHAETVGLRYVDNNRFEKV